MDNIFKDAKFGDKFRTRDGRMALFNCMIHHNGQDWALLCLAGGTSLLMVREHGLDWDRYKRDTDIVSRWEVQINEEELAVLAEAHVSTHGYYHRDDREFIVKAYKAGYRKAKEMI